MANKTLNKSNSFKNEQRVLTRCSIRHAVLA